MIKLLPLLSLIFSPIKISSNYQLRALIIRNVGQGQWVQVITPHHCIHFDMGGEYYSRSLNKYCKGLQNYLHLSHWDRDHINFISKFTKVNNICIKNSPKYKEQSLKKCSNLSSEFCLWCKEKFNSKNDNSYIYKYKNILLPGDSSYRSFKIWKHKLKNYKAVLLPHHGSKYSNKSITFKIIKAHMYIVSARKKRYGHPHPETLIRLLKIRNQKVITTENWGNIFIGM